MRTKILLVAFLAVSCGKGNGSQCTSGACSDAGLVVNELAGAGGDFVELFNASDQAFDLSGFGMTDLGDAGVRYATALRFASGTQVAARGYFTVFLETDCPANVSPCVRGEFGVAQATGDVITLLDAQNQTVLQQAYPPGAAAAGSSWARSHDAAAAFEVQRRSPGTANAP